MSIIGWSLFHKLDCVVTLHLHVHHMLGLAVANFISFMDKVTVFLGTTSLIEDNAIELAFFFLSNLFFTHI